MDNIRAGKQPAQAGYHVFTVGDQAQTNAPKRPSPGASETKEYKHRRFHTKSTLGCLTCKARRVKCDQAKPTCQRCKKKQVSCLYLQPHGGNLPSHYIKDLQALASSGRPLWPGRRSPSTVTEPAPHQKALSPQSTLDLRLLQHFDTFTSGDTVGPQVRKIFQGPILDLALERPYLMHAILAVSASHIRRLEPHEQGHRLAEVDHWHQALATFQRELQKPMNQESCDSILLTSMLLNLMSFAYIESRDPQDSWVFSTAPDRLDWLNIQLGLIPLLVNSRPFRENSILQPIFASSDDGTGTFADAWNVQPSEDFLAKIHPDFADLCKLSTLEYPPSSPYYLPLRLLSPMITLPRTLDNLFIFCNFVGSIRDDFLGLLRQNDERALLIFGYWLGLMCGIEKWWCEDRVRRDCRAICMYLDEKGGDGVKAMIPWMAWACGGFEDSYADPWENSSISEE